MEDQDEYNDDFDHEEDIAKLEHYQLYGDKPMLMPDLSRIGSDMFTETFRRRN